jgi:hypothetical protein
MFVFVKLIAALLRVSATYFVYLQAVFCRFNMLDHLIYQCNMLKNEWENLKTSVLKLGNWPVSKSELTNRYLKQFISYINSMDFEKINHSNEQM